jgi:hypothetical protein
MLTEEREIDVVLHVNVGNKKAQRASGFILCALHDEELIIVGRCGDQLDTYGTQWLA